MPGSRATSRTSPVIEVLVKPGDRIEVDTPLITLETDKATMDVPSTVAGTVVELLVAQGQPRVQGHAAGARRDGERHAPAARRACERRVAAAAPQPRQRRAPAPTPAARPRARRPRAPPPSREAARSTQLLVLGAGPGGYTAAFRAADLGLKVTLVERYERSAACA